MVLLFTLPSGRTGRLATQEAEAATSDAAAAPAARRRLRLSDKKIKIAVLLAVVMGVQVTIGYFLMPSVVTHDEVEAEHGDHHEAARVEEDHGVDEEDLVEFEIGNFSSTNSNAIAGTEIHISMTVVAAVSHKNHVAFEEAVLHDHPARIRQAIERVVRSSSIENLTDPDLNVIKRKIREDVNLILGKSYIIEVIISGYKSMHL
jgi:hypothetical protein